MKPIQKSITGQGWLSLLPAILVCGIVTPNCFAAEKNSVPKKSNIQPGPEAAISNDKSVEALAEVARRSVVIVSHFGRDGKEDGVGAGFVVSKDGLIATSLHVIGEARPISVQFADGGRFDATAVHAWDRKLDLAVVRIEATDLPALRLGDSDNLKQGTPVVAMGNPLGLRHSIVQGVVSAKRDMEAFEMIQLAIPIEPGNSGGPLLDMQGRVHGILTMKSAMTANLGFAMPVNALKKLLDKPNPVPMDRWLTIGALNPKDWTPLFGARWHQKAGRIQVDGVGKGFGGRSLCLSQKPVPERPYEIAVTVRLDDEAGAAGLVFASDGDQKHYGFYPSAGQLRLTRFGGPDVFSWTILQQVASPHYQPGDWNALKVRVEKEKILCYVNGHLVIESNDDVLTGGEVGLAKFRDTQAVFKDFRMGTNLISPDSPVSADLIASITKQIEKSSGKPDSELTTTLQSHATISQSLLAERARELEHEAARLRNLSLAVHHQSVQAELVKALSAPEEKTYLFRAAMLVAKLDNADLEIEAYQSQLEEMVRELKVKLPDKADDPTKLAVLTKYLFTENGFHGSRADFYNRSNSYLNEVMDDREGNPITLSVLFMVLAQRIGLERVVGIPLPAHFMVKHVSNQDDERLIDVFEGGKLLTRTEAAEIVMDSAGVPLRDEHLQPATKREIVVRMLRNLLGIAQRNNSIPDSLRYLDVIVAIAPEIPADRLDRARLRRQTGDSSGAKQDFKWLLDNQPPGVDLERIAEVYRSL